jgi:hypothetical protein
MSYEKITKKVDLKGQSKEKMQSYLISHYCRKLYRLSLLDIKNQKRKSNATIERVVRSREFSDPVVDNLLHKRSPEEVEEGQSQGEEDEDGEGDELRWKGGSFGTDFYDTKKTFEENFLDLLLEDALGKQEGLLIKEIRCSNQQRFGLWSPEEVHRQVYWEHAGQRGVDVSAVPGWKKFFDQILSE